MARKKSLANENWDYYTGDTFQYWNGGIPPDNHPQKHDFYRSLRRIYHSYNLVEEVVTHYVNSLVGKPFHWQASGANQAEATRILEGWWNWQRRCSVKQKLSQGKPIAEAIAQMLVRDNGFGDGSGFLRLFSPQKYKYFKDTDEPWKQFILNCPSPGTVLVEEDDDNVTIKAEHYHNNNKWVYELLDQGQCAITRNDSDLKIIDLGGKLPIFELNGKCIIGRDTKEIQNAVNHVLTLKDMNLKYAGFLERVLLNAAPPGKYVTQEDGTKKFVASGQPYNFGFSTATRITGLREGSGENWKIKDPELVYREPVSIENFEQSVRLDIETFYMSAGLGHLLSTGDGSVSGKSRVAAQKDYAVRLEGYSEIIESVIEDVFLAVLTMVNPELEAQVTVQLDLSHDLLKETVEIVNLMSEPGFISLDTGRRRLAIPNPEAEAEKIRQERQAEIDAGNQEKNFVEEFQ